MIKSLFRPIYVSIITFYNKFRYYIFPNLFSKVKLEMTNLPIFNQKTFLTGLGKVKIGENCSFGTKLGGFHYGGSIEIQARTPQSIITIKDKVSTNNNIFICSSGSIIIGSNSCIGQGVTIMDFDAHGIKPEKRNEIGEIGTIEIGENVWVGNNVIILKNSKIGNNSIIAAGAVVNGLFPENVIIGGVPAKIIKKI